MGMVENANTRAHGIVLAGVYPGGQSELDQLAPRPLLPVAQQPLITYALRWMKRGGVDCATICANSASRAIRPQIAGSSLGVRVGYHEDWSPRGAAGCVRDAGARTDADTFVVADGTSVPVVDLDELLEAHHAAGAAITVVVGADAAGRLRPSGVYVFDRRTFDFIPADGFQDIKEKLIPRLYGAGEQVSTHMARAVAPRVVNTDTYLALNHWAVERAPRHLEPVDGFRVSGEAVVHDSATVDAGARLLGPVLLGPRVSVEAGATLVGPVSLGPGTTVGRGAVVSRSVVWSGCVVGEGAFVDRCMMADRSVIGPYKSAFAVVKVADERGDGNGPLWARGPGRAIWDPIAAALRPATTHQL
jgi:mannose-1-phosphate guanylyltransferase